MNRTAIGNWRLTIASKPPVIAIFGQADCLKGNLIPWITMPQNLPIAYRQLPIACLSNANTFTVTVPVTSVMHQALAESVLIDVGRLRLGAPRSPRQANCALKGGPCIQ